MSRRAYSDEFKAAALAVVEMNDGRLDTSIRDIADLYGEEVPKSTLHGWINGRGVSSLSSQVRTLKKNDLIAGLEKILGVAMDAASDERKARATGFKDLSTSIGILVDKLRLVKGEATEISETRRGKTIRMDWGNATE